MGRKKRSRSRSRPRAHFIEERRDTTREQEFLNSEVDINKLGQWGEDALVRALVYELPDASQQEANEIALAVQRRLRGDASLLESPELSEELDQIRQDAIEIDKAAEAWESDRARFITDAYNRAPKLTDKQRETLAQRGKEHWKKTVTYMKAGKHTKQLQMMDRLQREDLEEIHVMGRPAYVNNKRRVLPDTVTVLGLRFNLKPGIHNVPKTVARAYREMVRQRAYAEAKQAVWRGERAPTGIWDFADVDRQLRAINKQYGVVMEDINPDGG